MRKLRRSAVGAVVLIGLLAGSGIALAQTEEEPVVVVDTETSEDSPNDTLFNFGYDLVNRMFVWGLSRLDDLYDCTLENGPLTATYGETGGDGLTAVEDLQDDQGAVVFPNRPAEEVADGLDPAEQPIPYSGSSGDCGVDAASVSGPNGQVNHGMFMKLFNHLYQGTGRGCVVRHLARSDLGKGEQQVKVGEATEIEPMAPGDTGTIDFESIEADCERGRKGGDGDEVVEAEAADGRPAHAGPPEHAGRPDHAGPPDHAGGPNGQGGGNGNNGSPGNSGSAPGHNK